MTLTSISSWSSFGGTVSVHDHESAVTGTSMRFAVFTPPQATHQPVPVIWYLSGLTCTWANVMEKSGLQRVASQLGVMVVAPDTSPRGEGVPDDEAYDLGQGAGFYLTATQDPWNQHYKMDQYITGELQALVHEHFPADMRRQGIMGHSMGGHGAITLHLKHPDIYTTCSAFAPITSPAQVPWGQKAFGAYLGPDEASWTAYDACALVRICPSKAHILIDTGSGDTFLSDQLRPQLFIDACAESGQGLTSRMPPGYDHSYYFVASFIEQHFHFHVGGGDPASLVGEVTA